MTNATAPVRNIILALLYELGISFLALFVVFPRIESAWTGALVQVSIYLVSAAPFAYLMRNDIGRLFTARWPQVAIGLSVLVAALLYAQFGLHFSSTQLLYVVFLQAFTGPIEELIFRGYVVAETLKLTDNTAAVVALNALCFSIAHVPLALADGDRAVLFGTAAIGGFLCLIRLKTRNLVMVSFLHTALNVAS